MRRGPRRLDRGADEHMATLTSRPLASPRPDTAVRGYEAISASAGHNVSVSVTACWNACSVSVSR